MNALNALETATNTIEASLVVEELSDADLMAICGGGDGLIGDVNVDASQLGQNLGQYLLYKGVNVGLGALLGSGVGRTA